MQNKSIINILSLCGTAVLITCSVLILFSLLSSPHGAAALRNTPGELGPGNAPLVNKALRIKAASSEPSYRGNFESPFKAIEGDAGAPTAAAPCTTAVPGRPKLTIKGLLLAGKPLAIMEDEAGKIVICGVGEEVHGEKVMAIAQNSVTLNGRHGSYAIGVKE